MKKLVNFDLTSTPYTLHPTPYTLRPTPYTLHRADEGARQLRPNLYALLPTPYTLHPTPYTLHPTPYTGPMKELVNFDFGGPLHSMIIPGEMHYLEEEMLRTFHSVGSWGRDAAGGSSK